VWILSNKIFQKFEWILDRASFVFLYISGFLTLIMGFTVTYGVVMRYVFEKPQMEVYELSMMFMVAGLVFAVAYVQRDDRHLCVDFLSSRMPPNVQEILLRVIVPIAGLFYVGVLTWKGWTAAMYSLSIGETSQSVWQEPLFPVKIIIPIGYGMCCLVLLSQITHGIASLKRIITKKQ